MFFYEKAFNNIVATGISVATMFFICNHDKGLYCTGFDNVKFAIDYYSAINIIE